MCAWRFFVSFFNLRLVYEIILTKLFAKSFGLLFVPTNKKKKNYNNNNKQNNKSVKQFCRFPFADKLNKRTALITRKGRLRRL